MNVTITPTLLRSRPDSPVALPASKSQAHRMILAWALSSAEGSLAYTAPSQDILSTEHCVDALLGEGNGLPLLDCGESGSTLRFLIPVALVKRGGGVFIGRGRLMERPQQPYFDIFREKGVFYEQKDGKLTVRGALTPGEYRLPGNVSSQFVTGLLFALPLLDGGSDVVLTSPLESRGYVNMTLDVLDQFGVAVDNWGYERFHIPGGQQFRPPHAPYIEPDWSQAAFWIAADNLGSAVALALDGRDYRSSQGDKVIVPLAEQLGRPGDVTVDVSQCPDLAPPLAAMAANREGTTYIVNAARLRIKESDRLSTIAQALTALGGSVTEGGDSLTIVGRSSLPGGVAVDSHNDHRIAMMAAILATRCEAPVTVMGAECVAKSYPAFWEDYRNLGGIIVKDEV